MDKPRIAFFDFDGTLTRHDSLFGFARHAVGIRKLFAALMKSMPVIMMWKLGKRSNSEAKEALFGYLYKGLDSEFLRKKAESFADVLDRDLRPETMEKLQEHLRNGDEVVIVSASMGLWIGPWARRHTIGKLLTTEPEVDASGKLTGKFLTPNCHGQEKERRILAAYPDIKEYTSYAYGDSSGDDAMLALADHGIKV